MPSLRALGEFMSSLNNVANEKDDLIAKNLPFNNPPLPADEAPPFDYSSRPAPSEAPSTDVDIDFNALLNSLDGDNSPPSLDSILQDIIPGSSDDASALSDGSNDFNDFLNNTPMDDMSFLDSLSSGDSGQPEVTETPAAGEDDYSIPDDLLSGLSEEIESTQDDSSDEEIEPTQDDSPDDFGMNALLSGLGGEDFQSEALQSENLQSEDLQPEEDSIDLGGESSSAAVFDDFTQGSEEGDSLPDFNFPTDELSDNGADESGINDGLDDAFDLGGESQHGTFIQEPLGSEETLEDFQPYEADSAGGDLDQDDSSIDLGGESPDMASAFSGAEEDESGGDILPDDFISESPPGGDFASSLDFADFDGTLSNDDFSSAEPAAASPGGAAGIEDFGDDFTSDTIELGGDTHAQDNIDLGSDGFSSGDYSTDDFALPGLDVIFEKSKIDTITQAAPKKGRFRKRKAKLDALPEADDDIKEISLSQDDVDKLLKTLNFYPLNLRIACEEIIAEQVILPAQLAKLIYYLVNGAHVRDTAALVEQITGKPVIIPKSFEKMTGAAFEAEQASFAYIFVHNFLPVLRLFAVIAALAASVIYLGYKFIYTPLHAESLYKRGYERIPEGEYQRANELFHDAFVLHRKKKWFYKYAEAFRDERRYMLSENKYDELLRYYPNDKKGVLDYANLETYSMLNYEKANNLLQEKILNLNTYDYEGLLAAGDNFLLWADSDPSKHYDRYEDARFSFARLLEKYGWKAPIVERMMKFFIRTDNLKETLYLRAWFENGRNRKLSPESLSELAGYLLDKQLEKPEGVPNPYVESIESVRGMLLQAIGEEPTLPEPHYHLARYHHNLGNTYEERLTLENAIRAFDLAKQESVRRRLYNVDTRYRYANILINNREFFPAEVSLIKGIELYEDFLNRNLIPASVQLGELYALKGDLEYFVKTGNMNAALESYRKAEGYGYSPPEIQYRMGSAYYQLENWRNALEYLFKASSQLPLNRRLLYALGNTAYKRGDYFAAEGYYNRLLSILENQRIRLPVLLPNDSPQYHELGLRLMWARNNAGVVYEALAEQTGNREYRSRAMVFYAESSLAWDPITRDPGTMVRARGVNLGYLNANNALHPASDYRPEIFVEIDKDVLEPSRWEELAPLGGIGN